MFKKADLLTRPPRRAEPHLSTGAAAASEGLTIVIRQSSTVEVLEAWYCFPFPRRLTFDA